MAAGTKGPRVKVVRLAHASGLALPAYQSAGAAGLDLVAAVPEHAPVLLQPGKRVMVPTGLTMEIPRGYEGQVRPRSGLAARYGITVLNSPGTIDADYRGEVQVILVNLGDAPFTITRGERIAQLVVAPVVQARVAEAKALRTTARGTGGFGSTGTRTASAAKTPKTAKKGSRSRASASRPKKSSPRAG